MYIFRQGGRGGGYYNNKTRGYNNNFYNKPYNNNYNPRYRGRGRYNNYRGGYNNFNNYNNYRGNHDSRYDRDVKDYKEKSSRRHSSSRSRSRDKPVSSSRRSRSRDARSRSRDSASRGAAEHVRSSKPEVKNVVESEKQDSQENNAVIPIHSEIETQQAACWIETKVPYFGHIGH